MSDRTPPRRGLGRGLGSLIPTGPAPTHAPGERPSADQATSHAHNPAPDGVPPAPGATLTQDHGPAQAGAETIPADWIGRLPGQPQPGDRPGHPATTEPAARQATADPELRPVHGAYFAELPVTSISPNPRQPRQVFDEEAMAELVHSIREVGLLQPVVVRRTSDATYELVMGERRWRATQEADLETIPAIVRDTADDALLRDALLENLHRAELNPLEEAAAYQQLLDDFGCTHEELASRIGRSRPQISNTIRLLRLSPPVQRRVAAGVLSAGHARTLLAIEDEATQDHVAGRVVAEGISVRGLEELVAVGDLDPQPSRAPRSAKPSSPALDDLAARLSDLYDTRVKVDLGRSKGRITIEFASVPDLERIVATMDPTYQRRSDAG